MGIKETRSADKPKTGRGRSRDNQNPLSVQHPDDAVNKDLLDEQMPSQANIASQEGDGLMPSVPDIQRCTVENITRQIENGTYEIDAEKIAEKMISDGMSRKTK